MTACYGGELLLEGVVVSDRGGGASGITWDEMFVRGAGGGLHVVVEYGGLVCDEAGFETIEFYPVL